MSIRLGLCEAPEVAQTVPINEHRGVGRPATLAKNSAWLDQPIKFTSQFNMPKQFISSIQATATATASASNNETLDEEGETINSLNTNVIAVQPKKRGRPPGSLNKKGKK